MNYKMLKCQSCGNSFVWSQEDQELYQRRGLSTPGNCPICRGIMEARERDGNRARMENNQTSNVEED